MAIYSRNRGGGGAEGIDELSVSKLCKTFGSGTKHRTINTKFATKAVVKE